MKRNNVYSSRNLLAFTVAFIVIGASVATVAATSFMVIEAETNPLRQTQEPLDKILVWTDKDTYLLGEIITIGVANPLDVRIEFSEDSYGLRIEKLIDGKWMKGLPIYNPATTETSELLSITESRGQSGEMTVTYRLPSDLDAGTYRVVSEGKAILNGTSTIIQGVSQFEIR